MTPEFYQSLPSPALQGEMLQVLLDAAVDSTQTSFITTARSVMQHVSDVMQCTGGVMQCTGGVMQYPVLLLVYEHFSLFSVAPWR